LVVKYCEPKASRYQNYAARFAAKEAFFKALGSGWRNGFEWKDIEVINDELGKPCIKTSGKVKNFIEEKQISNIQVSLSHVKEMATAIVILEE